MPGFLLLYAFRFYCKVYPMSGVYLETLEGDEEHSHDFYVPGQSRKTMVPTERRIEESFDFLPGEGSSVELDGDFGLSAIASALAPSATGIIANLLAPKPGASALTSLLSNLPGGGQQPQNPAVLAQMKQAMTEAAKSVPAAPQDTTPAITSTAEVAQSTQRAITQPASQYQTAQDVAVYPERSGVEEKQWYQNPLVWVGIGAGTAAAGTLIYLAVRK